MSIHSMEAEADVVWREIRRRVWFVPHESEATAKQSMDNFQFLVIGKDRHALSEIESVRAFDDKRRVIMKSGQYHDYTGEPVAQLDAFFAPVPVPPHPPPPPPPPPAMTVVPKGSRQ